MADNKQTEQNELNVELESLTLQELRVKAKRNYGLSITREHSAEEIRALIKNEANRFDFANEAVGELKPGWSRIKINIVQGKSRAPIYLNINGKDFGIPQNVECDVPNKVVAALRCAQESVPQLDENNMIVGYNLEESYPFSLIESKPGPDPRPGMEVQREARLKFKREFAEKEGYWPTDAVMAQQRQLNFIKGV